MSDAKKREFIARTIYHHAKRTNEHVTLLVYKDSNGAYELMDDREGAHDYLAGSEDYILKQWGEKNRQLIEDGFQRDNMMGDSKWQQFIG
jgi:hypothetical protein